MESRGYYQNYIENFRGIILESCDSKTICKTNEFVFVILIFQVLDIERMMQNWDLKNVTILSQQDK